MRAVATIVTPSVSPIHTALSRARCCSLRGFAWTAMTPGCGIEEQARHYMLSRSNVNMWAMPDISRSSSISILPTRQPLRHRLAAFRDRDGAARAAHLIEQAETFGLELGHANHPVLHALSLALVKWSD